MARSGGALKLPSGSGRSPTAKQFLVNCRLKIASVVAIVLRMFTRDTSTWSIAKKHNTLPCASITTMGPKSFSAVMVRKTTAKSERHARFVDLLEFGGLQAPKTS